MKEAEEKVIGVLGGVGPYAGLELVKKIFQHSNAKRDQDHLSVILISKPARISDRTQYLLHPDKGLPNPGLALSEIAQELADAGARVIGIPCNTAHSPDIINVFSTRVPPSVEFVHMLAETFKTLLEDYGNIKKIGLLATQGTHASSVYEKNAEPLGLTILVPEESEREEVHRAIYDPQYGIKAVSPVTPQAMDVMQKVSHALIKRGAQAIIMGCTEIPLAMETMELSVAKLDPSECLARGLIRHAAAHRLKSKNE